MPSPIMLQKPESSISMNVTDLRNFGHEKSLITMAKLYVHVLYDKLNLLITMYLNCCNTIHVN